LYNPSSKSKGSVELGNIILDYNSKKEFRGIQIMNASLLIREITGERKDAVKNMLTGLKACKAGAKA
jgi:uncharacterized protein YuzE